MRACLARRRWNGCRPDGVRYSLLANMHSSQARHRGVCSSVLHAAQVFKGLLDGVQTVAVKRLTDQSPRQQERFAQEIQLLRSCRAENIVSFLGAHQQLIQAALLHARCA